MANDSQGAAGESPIAIALFRMAVPALLGAILTYAVSISGAQTKQSEAIWGIQGQLATIVQQNADYVGRLTKVERAVDDNRRLIGAQDSRLSVVEARRLR